MARYLVSMCELAHTKAPLLAWPCDVRAICAAVGTGGSRSRPPACLEGQERHAERGALLADEVTTGTVCTVSTVSNVSCDDRNSGSCHLSELFRV
jgi:hypothetical protein